MSKLNIKNIYEACKDDAEYGILSEDQLNEFSLKGLKDKAKSLVGKAKDAVVNKAKEIKKKVDDKGGIKKIAGDAAKKAGDTLSKTADTVSGKASEFRKEVKGKGVKAAVKNAAGKAVDKVKSKLQGKKAEFDDKKEYKKEDIVDKVKKMDKVSAVKFIADEMKLKPTELITKNIGDISSKTAKKMGSAIANFGKDLAGTFSKNQTDANKDIDASKVDFDERKTFFSCVFELEDGKKILDVAKKIEDSLKEAPKIAEKAVTDTKEELKKAGVEDVSDEDIEKNTTGILGTIENNKKLDGAKLEDKLEDVIEQADAEDAAKEEVKKDDKEANESEMVNEAEANRMLGKVFNTFAGLFGKEAGMSLKDTTHIRGLSGTLIKNINGDGTGSYEHIVFNASDNTKEQFSSFGKLPGGLWWLPLAMIAKIAVEQKDAIIKAVGNTYLKWKDKQGAIAEMDFYVNKIRYSARYSVKDFAWKCVNVKDAKVKVDDNIMKAALDSSIGKKFKKHCISTWDKLFKAEEGKTAPFKFIIDNPDQLGLKKKEIELLKTIGDNYEKISGSFNVAEESEEPVVEKDVKTSAKDIAKTVGTKILDIIKKMAFSKAIKTLNTTTGGKFTEAVIDIYQEKVLDKAKPEELKATAKKIFDTHPEVAKAEGKEAKDKELDRRDDENTSTEIDEKSYAFSCMFEGEDGKKIKELILNLNKDSKEATDKVAAAQKDTEAKLKKAGIDDEDARQFGPAAAAMLDAGKKPEEVKKEIEAAKKDVKESVSECMKMCRKSKSKMIVESMKTKKSQKLLKEKLVVEAVNIVNAKYLTEGFLSNLFGKTVDLSTGEFEGETFWNKGDAVGKDAAKKLFNMLGNDQVNNANAEATFKSLLQSGHAAANAEWHTKTVGPAIQSTTSAMKIAAAWLPIITAAVIGVAYKYRKQINNVLQRQFTKFKNKKGRIAEVQFKTTGGSKNVYQTFFNVQDMLWRCMNKTDPNHQPSEELLKSSLDSDLGKKFREHCKKTWDPIFNSTENKELAVNFSEMLKEPEKHGLDKKVCDALKDFVEHYEDIEKNCLSDDYKFDIKLK